MYPGGSVVIMILLVCVLSTQYGRRKRQSGQRVTARDVVLAMAASWALGWFWLGLPALCEWGRHMPWSEILPAALCLVGIAIAPLALVLAATWLPSLFAVTNDAAKKPAAPHPLD